MIANRLVLGRALFFHGIVGGLLTLIPACVSEKHQQPMSMNQTLFRTATQIANLKLAAKRGDGAAAYELFNYYAFAVFDQKAASQWLNRSANLHYVPAMLSLGNLLVESDSAQDKMRGLVLIQEAKKLQQKQKGE